MADSENSKAGQRYVEDRVHRSWTMAQVKSKNITPEGIVRRAAHALGLRFRLHREDLPGKPDLVFPRLRVLEVVPVSLTYRPRKAVNRS